MCRGWGGERPSGKGLPCLRCLARWHQPPFPSLQRRLPPLPPPSCSTLAAPGRTARNSWDRGSVWKLETLLCSYLRARLLELKDTQHEYNINNHTDIFDKKIRSCYSCTETFQRLFVALGTILKSLPCLAKAVQALALASLPGFISSGHSSSVKVEGGPHWPTWLK